MSRESDSHVSTLAPQYFPKIDGSRMPALTKQSIEAVALILCGLSPATRDIERARPWTLHELRQDPLTPKVGPGSALRRDHRYLVGPAAMNPQGKLSNEDFDEEWQQSKSIAGSQESTQLLKIVNWLKRLELDEEGQDLTHPKWQAQMAEATDSAIRIQFYLYHSASRHIDRDANKRHVIETPNSVWAKLVERFKRTPKAVSSPIVFPPEVLRETEVYMVSSLNLGRIVRKMRQNHRQKLA